MNNDNPLLTPKAKETLAKIRENVHLLGLFKAVYALRRAKLLLAANEAPELLDPHCSPPEHTERVRKWNALERKARDQVRSVTKPAK